MAKPYAPPAMAADTSCPEGAVGAARPRAMAALLRRSGDLALAEEAFEEAGRRAFAAWDAAGPPPDPAGWLIEEGGEWLTPRLGLRRLAPRPEGGAVTAGAGDGTTAPGDMLRLLVACCHPALRPAQQIALLLRLIGGLPVGRIGRAFLIGGTAMERRLIRARKAAAEVGLPPVDPPDELRSAQLAQVMQTLWLTYHEGASAPPAHAGARGVLASEAVRLAALLPAIAPGDPEVQGLRALLFFLQAQRGARLDADGAITPPEEQDRDLWDEAMIHDGLALATRAMAQGGRGPFTLRAAIMGCLAQGRDPAVADWPRIVALYDILLTVEAGPDLALARVAALWRAEGPATAFAALRPLAGPSAASSAYHRLRARILVALGLRQDARSAFRTALALAASAGDAARIRRDLEGLADQP